MSIPLPRGFEQKYDAASSKYYYVDHANQKTQWVDPRLHHPAIWKEEQLALLEKFKAGFRGVPDEDILRQALINTCFDGKEAARYLVTAGHHPVVPRESASPGGAAGGRARDSRSPAHNKAQNGHSSEAQENTAQQLMLVHRHFPEVPNDILQEVIAACGGNFTLVEAQLKSLGFQRSGRGSRSRSRDENAAVEESPAVGHHAIADAEMWGGLRERQKQEETARKISADADMKKRVKIMLGVEFPSVSASSIERVIASPGNISQWRVELRKMEAHAKAAAKTEPVNPILPNYGARSEQSSPRNQAAGQSTDSPRQRQHETAIGRASPSRPAVDEYSAHPGTSSLRQTDQRRPAQNTQSHASLARGPDPSLCRGPNARLLSAMSNLAVGADPSLLSGPSGKLACGPNVEMLSRAC